MTNPTACAVGLVAFRVTDGAPDNVPVVKVASALLQMEPSVPVASTWKVYELDGLRPSSRVRYLVRLRSTGATPPVFNTLEPASFNV
jgi:hypothetical protein